MAMKDLLIGKLNDIYGNFLTAKQKDIIELFFDSDLSLGEIAEIEGITRQAAHDAINKGVAALKGYESELKLYALIKELEAIGEDMSKEEILSRIHSILKLREQ